MSLVYWKETGHEPVGNLKSIKSVEETATDPLLARRLQLYNQICFISIDTIGIIALSVTGIRYKQYNVLFCFR